MSDDELEQLIKAALDVQKRAYAPYSEFQVGAAILSESGGIYLGCNVENASYGLANCAERVAIGTMIASGDKEIAAVVVASKEGVSPCGACRQVLAEFGGDFPVHCVDSETGEFGRTWSMEELLPGRFVFKK